MTSETPEITPDVAWVTPDYVESLRGWRPTVRELFDAQGDIDSATGLTVEMRDQLADWQLLQLQRATIHQLEHIHDRPTAELKLLRALHAEGGGTVNQHGTMVSTGTTSAGDAKPDILAPRARAAVRLLTGGPGRPVQVRKRNVPLAQVIDAARAAGSSAEDPFQTKSPQLWVRGGF